MPKVICKKCGKLWWGWSLLWGKKQYCDCGEELKLKGGENRMKYNQWDKKELDYFNKPTMKAEQTNWFTEMLEDYFMWFVMAIMAGTTIWLIIKIIQLYRIEVWLKNI